MMPRYPGERCIAVSQLAYYAADPKRFRKLKGRAWNPEAAQEGSREHAQYGNEPGTDRSWGWVILLLAIGLLATGAMLLLTNGALCQLGACGG